MIDFKRADHIHICVPAEKLEDARQFYTTIIGLQEMERPAGLNDSKGYWFNIADIELHIGIEPLSSRSRRHSAFEINNITEAREHLNHHGVEIVEEPDIAGRERFAFIDPFGNKLELLQMIT